MQVTTYVVMFHAIGTQEVNFSTPMCENFDDNICVTSSFNEAFDRMRIYFEEDETITDMENIDDKTVLYTTNYGIYKIQRFIMWLPDFFQKNT